MRWIAFLLVLAIAGSLRAEIQATRLWSQPIRPLPARANFWFNVNGDSVRPAVWTHGKSRWLADLRLGRVEDFFGNPDDFFARELWVEATLQPFDWELEPFAFDWEESEIRIVPDGRGLTVQVERGGEVVQGERFELPPLQPGVVAGMPFVRAPVIEFLGPGPDFLDGEWSIVESVSSFSPVLENVIFNALVGGEQLNVELERWVLHDDSRVLRIGPAIPEPSAIILLGLAALLLPGMLAGMGWCSR